MTEVGEHLEVWPEAAAFHAFREMHYGRLDWLAEHIRRSNFEISPLVARKILSMLEGSEPECHFELKAVRRVDLAPRAIDPTLQYHRDADLALEVARRGGFRRAHRMRVCSEVGLLHGLSAEYVAKRVAPLRERALQALSEEQAAELYKAGKTDFLGRPKHS